MPSSLPALAGLLLPLLGLVAPVHPAQPAHVVVRSCVVYGPPPSYYSIKLVATDTVPGLKTATGRAEVSFARSPFGVSISPTGHYVYDLAIAVKGLRPVRQGSYAVWATTPDLDRIELLGTLDDARSLESKIDWNKFLLVLTLEPTARPGEHWTGPIVMRGMSRSGMMHTMAGHGPFVGEPCASYGY